MLISHDVCNVEGLRQTAQSNVPVAFDVTSPLNKTGIITANRLTFSLLHLLVLMV